MGITFKPIFNRLQVKNKSGFYSIHLTMTIQYASDLHLEFPTNRDCLKNNPLIKSADVLILAGDIFHLDEKGYPEEFLDECSKSYDQVFIVPGNHEFYGKAYPISKIFPEVEIKLRDNISVLNNQVRDIEGTRFIFSTLFTRIHSDEAMKFKRSMNDFHVSVFDEDSLLPLSIDQYNQCHFKSKAFLEAELEEGFNGRTVTVSHHVPYPSQLIPGYPDYGPDSLHNGFHVDLTSLMEQYPIDYWISGHTHFNHEPTEIHGTKCLTNQLGYVSYGEHRSFSREEILKIR